jgi:hypothetical protein
VSSPTFVRHTSRVAYGATDFGVDEAAAFIMAVTDDAPSVPNWQEKIVMQAVQCTLEEVVCPQRMWVNMMLTGS